MSDSVNPLLDEESVLPSSRSLVNPLMEDDEDENGLPDLDLDFLDAGDFSAPSMVDSTDAENPYPVNYDDYAVMDRYRDEDGSEEDSVGRGSVGDSIEEFLQFSGADYEPDDFSSVDDSFDDSASVEYGEDLSEEVQSDGSLQEDEPSVMGDSLESIIGLTSSVDDSGNVFHDFEDEDEDDEERYYTLKLDEIITRAIDMGASDIDLIANDEVSFSILGNMKRIPEFGILNYRQINNAYEDITTHVNQESFIQELELDTSYEVRSGVYAGRRLRLNVAKSFDTIVLTFRVISNSIPSPDELGIDDRLLKWIDMPNGLVLVNGSTGMGKSTTLASMIREIQLRHPKKVVTVEKPVEYVYGVSGRGVVHQREVGRDTKSFGAGLDSAMRQHPDVILIGEVRNKEEANALLYAADTGHLAFSTMHTNSAADTLNRIKRMFSGDEQIRVLGDLSESARGFVNQLLIRSPDGKSRFAVREILDISDDDVKDLIRHGNVRGLRDYQMEHEITMEHELTKAVKDGLCTIKDALNASPNRPRMEKLLKQNNIDF